MCKISFWAKNRDSFCVIDEIIFRYFVLFLLQTMNTENLPEILRSDTSMHFLGNFKEGSLFTAFYMFSFLTDKYFM